MYLDHFGLSEPPFRITPHTEFFFAGANRGATLEALIYAITHDEGIVKVSGEVGSGKTMLCRVLMERLPANVNMVYLANPSLSRDDILFSIADELGLTLPDDTRVSAVLRTLHNRLIELYGDGRQIVVLIDEAHAMPLETLEEIRLLSNLETGRHKLLQLVLFGQPELDEILARPNMRQLKERITQNFRLEPLRRDDIAAYIDFRLRTAGYRGPNPFSPSALKRIADASQGLTRRVNILADKALLAAYADNRHEVTPRQVDAAVRDADYGNAAAPWRRHIPVAAALAAFVAAGTAVVLWQPDVAVPVPDDRTRNPAGMEAATEAAPPPTAVPMATAHVAASRQWIEATAGDRWFIQLATLDARQQAFAQSYYDKAVRLLPADQVRTYVAGTEGSQRLGIIYGDFPSWQAASEAVRQLPRELIDNNPYPRQVRWLK